MHQLLEIIKINLLFYDKHVCTSETIKMQTIQMQTILFL